MLDLSSFTLATAPPPVNEAPPSGQTAGPTQGTPGGQTTLSDPSLNKTPNQNNQGNGTGGTTGGGIGSYLPFLLMALLVGVIFMSFSGKNKEKKKREAMLSAIKKGDRVATIGGILGHIVEMRENEIVLQVDGNTRIKFTRTAIQGVVEEKEALPAK